MKESDKTIESLKQDFIQEVMSESSFDTLKEWLYMHEEARYVASLTSSSLVPSCGSSSSTRLVKSLFLIFLLKNLYSSEKKSIFAT
jgi:hypothetical protein